MRLLTTLLLILLANGACSAQQEPIAITNQEFGKIYFTKTTPKVTGRIRNASPEELAGLKVTAHKVYLIGDTQGKEVIKLQNDGTFEITVFEPLPYQQIWFMIDKLMSLCLYVHDGVFIDLDLKILKQPDGYQNDEVLKFNGPDSAVCSTMNRYYGFKRKNQLDFDLYAMAYKPDDRYFPRLDSLLAVRQEADQRFVAVHGSQFKFLIDNETKSDYLQWKATYYFRYFSKNRRDPEIGYDFSEYLEHPIYAISNSSKILLKYLLYAYLTSRSERMKQSVDHANLLSGIDSTFGKDYGGLLMFQIEDPDITEQKRIFEKAHSILERDWQKASLKKYLEEVTMKANRVDSLLVISESKNEKSEIGIFKLETPFGGHLFVSDKTTGRDLLKAIRSAYPDKLIILDIWATWCAPCMEQMPYSKNLHQETKRQNLPVEFVYLCTSGGSKEDKWTNKIVELELPGTHVYVDENHINELFELFKKSGYPSYVVIKPDGRTDVNAIQWMHGVTLEDLKKML